MRSGGNSFNYFPENKLTKLANFVQFIHMLDMFCLEDWGACSFPLATPLRNPIPNCGDLLEWRADTFPFVSYSPFATFSVAIYRCKNAVSFTIVLAASVYQYGLGWSFFCIFLMRFADSLWENCSVRVRLERSWKHRRLAFPAETRFQPLP